MESGRLMEGGRLISGRLIEVGLYHVNENNALEFANLSMHYFNK